MVPGRTDGCAPHRRAIRAFRNQAGGQPTGDWSHCGWAGYALCWTWSGSAHFDFTSIHVGLTLAQNPDTTVWQGSSATFTAGRSQTYFPPNQYPVDLSALQWRWIPDSASADTVACHSYSSETCTHVFTTSGTMYAAAYVNGEAQQKMIHVDVRTPELELTASASEVNEGDPVTFTGSLVPNTPGYQVIGWSWVSDSPSSGPLASRSPLAPMVIPNAASRSRTVETQRASSNLSSSASTVVMSLTDSVDVADDEMIEATSGGTDVIADDRAEPVACTTGTLTCTMPITKDGTITLTVNVGGTIKTRTAHVAVRYQCPPFFPRGLVLDVGDKTVSQAATKRFRWIGGMFVPIEEIPATDVLIRGPWTLVQDMGYDPRLNANRGRYLPGTAANSLGNRYFDHSSSWVEFACRTQAYDVDSDGEMLFKGRMEFLKRIDIKWIAPPK
jgi:hypothetical protein